MLQKPCWKPDYEKPVSVPTNVREPEGKSRDIGYTKIIVELERTLKSDQ
jgi:hypothetical protein